MGAISAAMPLESSPPDKKSPSGTSLIRWLWTAAPSLARTSRATSGSGAGVSWISAGSFQ